MEKEVELATGTVQMYIKALVPLLCIFLSSTLLHVDFILKLVAR